MTNKKELFAQHRKEILTRYYFSDLEFVDIVALCELNVVFLGVGICRYFMIHHVLIAVYFASGVEPCGW